MVRRRPQPRQAPPTAAAPVEPARIVLVKPGDVLIFGNVSADTGSETFAETMTSLQEQLGLARVLVFEDDIDLAVQQGNGDGTR